MSKEIGYFARNYGRDRTELKEFAQKLLPPECLKVTKGLLWVDDKGIALLEAALNRPEEPRSAEPEVITVMFRPGAKNPRYEYAQTEAGEKIGVLIPSRTKGRYLGRLVKVEVFTCNDGIKTYRLLCKSLQNIA